MELLLTAVMLCNNDNYQHSIECQSPPAIIIPVDNGFIGYLENGIYWEQKWVDEGTMRFTMQEVDYNITKDGITYNNGDN